MRKNKVVLVGTGMVGMSYAYSLMNQGIVEELVLIDIDKERSKGEALDLNHGLSYAPRKMKVYAGKYSDCKDADIICITAGAISKEGETRLDLLHKNTAIMKGIIENIKVSGFDGILLIASNPVDIMTHVAWKLSGLPKERVIGSGTTLDSARLRHVLANKLDVDARNIHAYVLGEHGDSQFVAWSHALCGVQPICHLASKDDSVIKFKDFDEIENDVKNAAYEIIKRKKSTYYGIGMALTRITKAILENENSVLTVSSQLNGEYGNEGVFIAVPSIVNRDGVRNIVELALDSNEREKFNHSVSIMKANIDELKL